MGLVLGKITVETPKYEVLHSCPDYEIRRYSPSVVAEVTYDPKEFKGDRDGGFPILGNYIGALGGQPQNSKIEKIAMTAPAITKIPPEPEKIAMTAPVVTTGGGMVTVQFGLPSKYQKAEDAPKPTDDRVVIKEEGERKYGIVKFSGVTTDKVVQKKARKLKESLQRDGHKAVGDFLLARYPYNPLWTPPPLRTSEIRIPVE